MRNIIINRREEISNDTHLTGMKNQRAIGGALRTEFKKGLIIMKNRRQKNTEHIAEPKEENTECYANNRNQREIDGAVINEDEKGPIIMKNGRVQNAEYIEEPKRECIECYTFSVTRIKNSFSTPKIISMEKRHVKPKYEEINILIAQDMILNILPIIKYTFKNCQSHSLHIVSEFFIYSILNRFLT